MHEGNFTFENLTAAKNRLNNWRRYASLRHQVHSHRSSESSPKSILASIQSMQLAINDNLNTPEVLRIIDDTFSRLDAMPLSTIDRDELISVLHKIDDLLGINLIESTPDITDSQKSLIIERNSSRADKDWVKSDTIRDGLLEQGIELDDTPSGTVWFHAS